IVYAEVWQSPVTTMVSDLDHRECLKRPQVKPSAGGTVSVHMTAQEIISLAVNAVQNSRSLDDLSCGSEDNALALQGMLAEVYGHVLTANRQAASRLAYKRRGGAANVRAS